MLVTVVEEVLIVTVMILVSNKMTVVRTTHCSAKLLTSLYLAATVDVARYPRMDVSVMRIAAKLVTAVKTTKHFVTWYQPLPPQNLRRAVKINVLTRKS